MKRSIIITFIAFFSILHMNAEDRMTVNGVQYATTSKSTVTACLTVKAIGDVEIKEKVKIRGKEYTTDKIGKAYFSKNDYLQSIVIPNTVRLIQKGAFKGCANLVNVVVPDTLCQVEAGAFEGCKSIAVVRTYNRDYSVDYALAAMPQGIPYYEVKDDIGSFITGKQVEEIMNDREYNVDEDIPETGVINPNSYAFVIGNEDYSLGDAGIPNVEFAVNDATVFAKYCEKTLGIPHDHVKLTLNATLGKMRRSIRLLKQTAEANKDRSNSTIIFYYAGHGIPDEATKSCYLLPIDADGKSTNECYSLDTLYAELAALPIDKICVFIDACFSGAQRGNGMLASARGVAIEANSKAPQEGNTVVFTAAQGSQTAYPYKEKQHGMFTYYVLNQLHRYKGDCTLEELGSYVEKKVRQKSIDVNGKEQSPTVIKSENIAENWKNEKLK